MYIYIYYIHIHVYLDISPSKITMIADYICFTSPFDLFAGRPELQKGPVRRLEVGEERFSVVDVVHVLWRDSLGEKVWEIPRFYGNITVPVQKNYIMIDIFQINQTQLKPSLISEITNSAIFSATLRFDCNSWIYQDISNHTHITHII